MARLASSFLMLALVLAGPSAGAQVPSAVARTLCHDYKEIVRQLGSRYDEVPVSTGLQSNGHLLQVFASPKTGSWTILSIAPDGTGCVLAAGRSWESQQPAPKDPPA
ncbi:MAG: hypothetical protein RMK81_12910 [Geminicoccaceae bacterium]|nr:hypothetical protein [Geminicoccaceae bacterium]MDW8371168.1 hypothetical protein [Geminicoccaceae bacterium]